MKKYIISIVVLNLVAFYSFAQDKELGDKEYVIMKDYKPVLTESNKISDSPEGDTSYSNPPKMNYTIEPKKLETNFEAGVIRAVKIKEEPIAKLYHSLVKLGLGSYNAYTGELFYNSLRSKTGQVGVHLKHFSSRPIPLQGRTGLYSNNLGEVYGKYFLDNATFSSSLGYERDVFHYYGFYGIHNEIDSVITTKPDATKQRFNNFNFKAGIISNWVNDDHINYDATFQFNGLNDKFGVSENDFNVWGGASKAFDENLLGLGLNFDYFKKQAADFEKFDLNSNAGRYIVTINPHFTRDFDRIHLNVGFNFSLEHNSGPVSAHFYPDVNVSVPIAEHIVYIFADVTGGLQKSTYKTLTDENPFTIPSVKLLHNQSNDLILDGGLKGNFSSQVSFNIMAKYTKMTNMVLFVNDTALYVEGSDSTIHNNMFNIVYDEGKVFDIHAEVAYRNNEKLSIALAYDYLSYETSVEKKAWHKPNSEARLMVKYNLKDKIQANVTFLAAGSQYARSFNTDSIPQVVAVKLKGYYDFNIGLEYRYNKVLSFYFNMNNLFFTRYEQWYGYPSEKFNLMGGLTYSF
ncbi:MAG: hypothetical protein ABI763_01130 [Bacteroidota bacterium]